MNPEQIIPLTPYGVLFTATMGLLVFFLRREYAAMPIILTAMYVTFGQRIIIFGFHFTMLRFVIAFGVLRVLFKGEIRFRLNALDKCIILYVIAGVVMHTVQRGTTEALVNRLGFAYNALGTYFLFRCFISSLDDVALVLKSLCIAVIPLTLAMTYEWATGTNLFAVLGGVRESSEVRYGEVRCQGPFLHSILAGTFGATLMPLIAGLWFRKGIKKWLPVVGAISASLIMVFAHSSGPVSAYVAAILALLLWPFRGRVKQFKWALGICLLTLHLIMKAPVWFLSAKLSALIGGDGWYRSQLIDAAITHFGEWWLVGTSYTINWLASNEIEPGMADITSQYVAEGVNGGLLTLVLFISVIFLAFRRVGQAVKQVRGQLEKEFMIWAVWAALFAHTISFLSIGYYDQIVVFWYLLLAIVAALEPTAVGMTVEKETTD